MPADSANVTRRAQACRVALSRLHRKCSFDDRTPFSTDENTYVCLPGVVAFGPAIAGAEGLVAPAAVAAAPSAVATVIANANFFMAFLLFV